MVILTFEKVKVLMSPLCVVDIEMFTDEEAKGAESAKDEQQEGREELRKKYFFLFNFGGIQLSILTNTCFHVKS